MLIRSQDKLRLVPIETDSISIEKYKKINGEYHANAHPGAPGIDVCVVRGVAVLGEYSSEEKAIKVLDMIQNEYGTHYYGSGGPMATANFYIPPFGYIPPKVFQMPQDSEVQG